MKLNRKIQKGKKSKENSKLLEAPMVLDLAEKDGIEPSIPLWVYMISQYGPLQHRKYKARFITYRIFIEIISMFQCLLGGQQSKYGDCIW